jgi:hypothetical protein
MLEKQEAFLNLIYDNTKQLIIMKSCFQKSALVFSTIYGFSHPFVSDYVLKNYPVNKEEITNEL